MERRIPPASLRSRVSRGISRPTRVPTAMMSAYITGRYQIVRG